MDSKTNSSGIKPSSTIDDLRDIGGRANGVAKDEFDNLRDGAADAADSIQDQTKDVERSVEEFVREQPMKALLIAAGAGILLGRFLMR